MQKIYLNGYFFYIYFCLQLAFLFIENLFSPYFVVNRIYYKCITFHLGFCSSILADWMHILPRKKYNNNKPIG